MSIAASAPPTPAAAPPARGIDTYDTYGAYDAEVMAPDLEPAGDRGRLTITEDAVAKIAAALLGEVDQIGGAARRVLGVTVAAAEHDQRPRVEARVVGSVVTLEVRCSLTYPTPVAATADRARRHLITRIGALTGLRTERVDIIVTALTPPPAHQRRELR